MLVHVISVGDILQHYFTIRSIFSNYAFPYALQLQLFGSQFKDIFIIVI